ncbi:acyltransferase family protein [Paracoccus sp. R86501]|uniref:acyltransferase family protein n=1 Tax=Paracoccus sp. R86501 TaxID=3101711 RepID=UPI00366BDAC9
MQLPNFAEFRLFKSIINEVSDSKISPHDAALLDVLRAIAASLVVIFHAKTYTLGGSEATTLDNIIYSVANCGTQAVFWFFVLSGYLVGGPLVTEILKNGRMNVRKYITARSTRLYIVLIPALIITGLFDYIRTSNFEMNANAGFETILSYSALTAIGNILFLQTTLVPTYGSNLALWSLANEFWYYLIFPLLLAPIMSEVRIILKCCLFLLGVGTLVFLFYSNFSIVWLFSLWLMGVAARVVPVKLMKSKSIAIILAVSAAVCFPAMHPYIGPVATLVVGLSFTNMLLSLRSDGPEARSSITVAARRCAAFSFSLYITHLPLQHLLLTFHSGKSDPFLALDPRSIEALATIIILTFISVIFAYFFSLATEIHTESLRRWLLRSMKAGTKTETSDLKFH